MGKQYVSLADSLRDAAQDFSQKITFDEDTEAEVMDCLTDFNLEVIGAAVIKDCDGRMRIEAKIKPAANLERSKDKLIEKVSQATGMTFDDLTIDNVGNGCRLIFIESQPIIIKYAKQQRIKGGETVSGDKITAFRTGNGKYVIFLSDGMGSGEEAAADSHLACATVQKILRSGLSSDMALRALNTVFMLKDREEAVTTLDFSIIDLESGATEIIKAGAAPTYIKNGNDIIKIKSGSVPAGVLDKLYFDRNMIKLGQGSILLMISDGMISDGDDDYIIDHLKNFEGQDPELLLSEIIEAALLRKDALSDDMSAAICILEEKD